MSSNKFLLFVLNLFITTPVLAQLRWQPVDSLFGDLPASVAVFRSTDSLDGQPGIAYYVKVDLSDPGLMISVDSSRGRRLTPTQFYERNQEALLVMNGTFFSFETNQNLGLLMDKGKLLAYNVHANFQKKDSLYNYVLPGSFGINRQRNADIAWVFTDSNRKKAWATQEYPLLKTTTGSDSRLSKKELKNRMPKGLGLKPWRMQTALAGGPVVLQNGEPRVYNNEERKFMGKGIQDRHPRTVIGYTADGYMILLVIEGRRPGVAAGATLMQEAIIMRDLGCVEALNLDGGGSSCLLVNGRETIRPSDKQGLQRPVPGVLLIQRRN